MLNCNITPKRSSVRTLLLALALAVVSAGPISALTLSELRTEVRLRIKDSNANRQRYSDSQLTSLLNEAQRDVVNVTWAVQKSESIELEVGTTYYSLPTDFVTFTRVTRLRKNLPEVTLQAKDAQVSNGDWETPSGTPNAYFQDPAQPGSIGVVPWPNSSSSTGTLRIQYVAQVDDLSLDADEPFEALDRLRPYHDLLVHYVCYRVFLIEGEVDKATTYRNEYEARLMVMRERIGSKPNYNPGFSGNQNR